MMLASVGVAQPEEQVEETKSVDILQGRGIFISVESLTEHWGMATNTTELFYSVSVEQVASPADTDVQNQNQTQKDNQTASEDTDEAEV